jgi:hypothetical protein
MQALPGSISRQAMHFASLDEHVSLPYKIDLYERFRNHAYQAFRNVDFYQGFCRSIAEKKIKPEVQQKLTE